jgi:ribulose-phosphate 3-epimerase
VDLILLMSGNPGFGGQSFIENTYNKVSELNRIKKENDLNFQIQVDGGVNDTNATKLISLGATNLVAGSFIFKSDNYTKQLEKLR